MDPQQISLGWRIGLCIGSFKILPIKKKKDHSKLKIFLDSEIIHVL